MRIPQRKSNRLAGAIKNLMKNHNISLSDIANETNVTVQAVSNWTKGSHPREDAYNRLREVFVKYKTEAEEEDAEFSDIDVVTPTDADIFLSQATLEQLAIRARELGMKATFTLY